MPYRTDMILPTPENNEYSFEGWFIDSDFQYPFLISNYKEYVSDKNITVYAKWDINTYFISYILNGGTNRPNPTSYTFETSTITLAEPFKEGYTFGGWFDNAKMAGDAITQMTEGSFGDVTLYAKWNVNQYTISFYTNGGSSVDSITQDYASAVIQPASPTKEGYTFGGWYSNGQLTSAYSFSTMTASNITLYAKWNTNIYSIGYELDGGTNRSNPTSYTIETSTITLAEPTKEGYIFDGWFDNANMTGNVITHISKGSFGNITLYARWAVNQYDIIFLTCLSEFNFGNITLLAGETITQISLGTFHSSALTSKGRIFTWGDNEVGQLGDGTTTDKYTPTEITNQFGLHNGETITQISLGTYNSSALTSEGRVFTWGWNYYGQLGDGTTTSAITPIEITSQFELYTEETIVQVSLGGFHSSVLTSEGRVFTWGDNEVGQLGDGTTTDKYTSVEITGQFGLYSGETIIQVSLGYYYSSALTSEGRIFTWGDNERGQLGNGTTTDQYTPTEITGQFGLQVGEKIVRVSMGGYHSSALTSEGRIFTWGYNYEGKLGNGATTDKYTPTEITNQFGLHTGEKIVQISLGAFHSIVLTSEGRIFTWGYNYYGELGDGTTTDQYTPMDVTSSLGLHAEETIAKVALGDFDSSVITTEGRVFTWGDNEYGELGDDTTTDQYTPTEITSLFGLHTGETIIQVSLRKGHSSAITSEGRIFTWGFNANGELGDGTTTNTSTPIEVSSSSLELDSVEKHYFNDVITEYIPTFVGYSFCGWYTDPGLTTRYIFTTMPAESIILYGSWRLNTYSIVYELDGGTDGSNPTSYTIESSTIILAEPTKEGYTFNGWFDNAEMTGEAITQIAIGSYSDITLYAKWTENQ